MNMRLQIPDQVNRNTYVHLMGWCYPIQIYDRKHYNQAVQTLEATSLGASARRYYFSTGNRVKHMWQDRKPLELRWYAGTRKWTDTGSRDFWLVFRSDADRTLALLHLNH